MQHNNNLALRLLSRRLQFQQGCSLSPCQVGITDCLVHYPTYSYVGHNSQQPHNVCHTSWPKWPAAAAMVPYSQRWCTQRSPSMLADCCMRQRREWGTMAAMGWQQPPRLVGHGLPSIITHHNAQKSIKKAQPTVPGWWFLHWPWGSSCRRWYMVSQDIDLQYPCLSL